MLSMDTHQRYIWCILGVSEEQQRCIIESPSCLLPGVKVLPQRHGRLC